MDRINFAVDVAAVVVVVVVVAVVVVVSSPKIYAAF